MTPVSLPANTLNSLVDDVCATLSIVQGRKIEWIQRTTYTPQARIAWSELCETQTKNYSHGLLCFDPDRRNGISLSLDSFAAAFRRVREFHEVYDPDHRIVNSWLDARLEDDFLEARTLMRIPMMSISHSDLMPIRAERSDAELSQFETVIDISQEICLFSVS